jgi:hypothetical protein
MHIEEAFRAGIALADVIVPDGSIFSGGIEAVDLGGVYGDLVCAEAMFSNSL